MVARGKYAPLWRSLAAADSRAVTMTFDEMAAVVGGLPPPPQFTARGGPINAMADMCRLGPGLKRDTELKKSHSGSS